MNKTQLIEDIAHRTDTTSKVAKDWLEKMVAAISDGVTIDGKVSIPGFGSFNATDVAAREVRNPSTGQSVLKPATRRVGFKPGSHLKEQVAGGTSVQAAGAR